MRLLASRGSASPQAGKDGAKEYKARADEILRYWPGDYRLGINRLMRHIQNDTSFMTDAKDRYIDARNWSRFSNSFRRNLIKEPITALNNDTELFVKMCKYLKPLSSLTVTLMDTPTALVEGTGQAEGDEEDIKKAGKRKKKKNWTKSKEGEAFEGLVQLLRYHIMQTAEKELHSAIAAYRTLINTSDLKNPEEWYPYARLSTRKIV